MANEMMEEKVKTEPGASWTALENTRLAYERTLMAWVRTSVSLITFGFTIYKFFQYMQESQGAKVVRLVTPRTFGMLMISAGLFTLLMATLEHWRSMKRLKEQLAGMKVSIAMVLAVWISAIGILALIGAFFRQ
jgi:putative membrane protein